MAVLDQCIDSQRAFRSSPSPARPTGPSDRLAYHSGMKAIHARWALRAQGWTADVVVRIDDAGRLADVQAGEPPTDAHARVDLLLPAMPDAHCHAFQRAIAGLTETPAAPTSSGDDFWTWRERMYAAVDRMDADTLYREATALYRALRMRGYGGVAEFHYVHRLGGDGPRETADALIAAARAARMPLLLLPVLYRRGGLDGAALSPRQQRFALSLDDYGTLLQWLAGRAGHDGDGPGLRIGIAPHSLRAVGPSDLQEALALRAAILPDCPVHLHVSEQVAEVEAAIASLGTRPVHWLCDHAPVDAHWCLVHATHADRGERDRLLAAGATIGLCPTTEANLGDGSFPIEDWWQAGGAFAIGSDSNVGIDPREELRWLEYQARLRTRRRSVLVADGDPGTVPGIGHGTGLWQRAAAGGRRALGFAGDGFDDGSPAPLIAIERLDADLSPDRAVDDWLFAQRATRGGPVG